MDAIYNWLNALMNKNKSDFAQWPGINWLNPYAAFDYQQQRDIILSKIGDNNLFNNTKPFHHQISEGCKICGSGKWSCLFITNKCNANCFYCPTQQTQDELPSTQGLDFTNPADYAEYVKFFDFKGVSFSGGEPLLFFDRTSSYLQHVRKQCANDVYTWIYTNGILADRSKMHRLADLGLNEIRFDIGATGFSLDKVKIAKGIIPNITIEIPAIPEEKDQLINLLPKMKEAGVTNLNLHQLRLTPHNANNLTKRGYTIINAERPIVLESELAALEIIDYARQHDIEIGINYCSFHFKNRFQKAGFRNIIANSLKPSAKITSNGFIREYDGKSLRYKTIKVSNKKRDMGSNIKIYVNGSEYFIWEDVVFHETNLCAENRKAIEQLFRKEPDEIPNEQLLFKIWQFEYIEHELRTY